MENDIKVLLHKYIRKECTPAEIDEVVLFFQKATDADAVALPTVEEVLELLDEKEILEEESSEKILKAILSISKEGKNKRILFRKAVQRIAAAAVVTGILFAGLYFKQDLQFNRELTAVPAEQFVTIELGDGKKTILENTDSFQITDAEGDILGVQRGSAIEYAPEKEVASLHYNTIRVPHGKRFELSLSDGTKVHLNAGTTLKFPVSFVKRELREVFLTGEAFFEVAEDKAHPFIVNTGGLSVEVLGTEFNVEAYEQNASQKVVLVEGMVNVQNDEGRSIVMEPSQMVSSKGKNLYKTTVNPSHFISWKDGYFTLQETSVAETIALLERYYHIKISSEEQKDPHKIVGSGKVYLSDKVENVISTLSLLTKNEYSFNYKKF